MSHFEPPNDCEYCPRLAKYRKDNQIAEPSWFNAPVPSFGNLEAAFLIVGLAPGLKGANKTGRPFTGDYAGDLLYTSLAKFGFSSGNYAGHAGDGLQLSHTCITNAVRCVPPQNKPETAEINNCRQFLRSTIANMPNLKVIMALGKIAHDSTVRSLDLKPSQYPFAHESLHRINWNSRTFRLISSYHCSRYNTNTGRLTREMFWSVLECVRQALMN